MPNKEGDVSAQTTARGMIFTSTRNIATSLSAAVFFVLVARYLPVSDLGFITGLQTIIAMFINLSSMGISPSATRFISTLAGSGEDRKAAGLYPLVFILSVVTSGIFGVLLYYVAPYLSEIMFHDLRYSGLVELASLDVFLFSIATASIFLLYAYQQFLKITVISIINSVLKFSLSYILLLNGFGLEGILIGLIVGDSITLIMFVYVLWPKILVKKKDLLYSASELRPLLKYSLSIYGSMILNVLSTKVDVYLLLLLSSLYVVGIYSAAAFIANTFFLVLSSIDQALLPYTASMFGKSGLQSFRYLSRMTSRYLFLFYFPMGFAIASSAPSLIVLTVGSRFTESAYALAIIVISITMTSMTIVFSNLLRAAGDPSTILKANIIALVMQLTISIGTISFLGAIGAAVGRSISRAVLQIYPARKLKRLDGLEYDKQSLKNGLTGSALICIVIISTSAIPSEPYFLPLWYLVAGLVYLLFLRISHSLNSGDIEFIDKTFVGRMKWLTVFLAKIVVH